MPACPCVRCALNSCLLRCCARCCARCYGPVQGLEAREFALLVLCIGDAASFDRIEEALLESSRLLRTTVSELHPAVLDRAGLTAALGDLVRTAAGRAGVVGEVSTDGWPDERTPLDGILYRTARELVGNAAKHASASTLRLSLTGSDGCARLVVADDGVGLPADAMTTSLRRGHIGLASHRVRIEAAGGTFTAAPAAEGGTVVAVQLPL